MPSKKYIFLDFTEATVEQTIYWIQVDSRTGISDSDADEAIRILNRLDD